MNETALQSQTQHLPAAVVDAIKPIMSNLTDILPSDIAFQEFRTALWLELSNRHGIEECMPDSIVDCTIKAAQSGMLPYRDCHFLPFKDKRRGGRKAATFVPNYFGILRALDRTGKVAKSFANPVYSGDRFEVDFLDDTFHHTPAQQMQRARGSLICFYACILRKSGTRHVEIMDLEQIDAVKRRSPAHESGPWTTDYERMACKTVLKRVAKYVQLTPEVEGALAETSTSDEPDFNMQRGPEAVSALFPDPPRQVINGEQVDIQTGEVLESKYAPGPGDLPNIDLMEIEELAEQAVIPMAQLEAFAFKLWKVAGWKEANGDQITGLIDELRNKPGALRAAMGILEEEPA